MLSGVIRSGQLSLLRDGVLRGELAGWLDQVEAHKLHAANMWHLRSLVAELWAAPVTPRTNFMIQFLWSGHLNDRRILLEGMNDLLNRTVGLIALLEAAATP